MISSSVKTHTKLKKSERADFLAPLVRASLHEADARGESLALVRPKEIRLEAIKKSDEEIRDETQKHKDLAAQLSLLDEDSAADPITPCRMQFIVHWKDQDGRNHRQECDDWETAAAFNRFDREYGEKRAIEILKDKYEKQYFNAGLVLGFSTHSRRNIENNTRNQWLLVGLVRLDESDQTSLPL